MSEIMESFEIRAEEMLSRVFGGMHHIYSLKKEPQMWSCIHYGDCATFDGAILTRIVLAAHEYCLRIAIKNGGPSRLKIIVWPRLREGAWHEKHPSIQQAIETWEKSR